MQLIWNRIKMMIMSKSKKNKTIHKSKLNGKLGNNINNCRFKESQRNQPILRINPFKVKKKKNKRQIVSLLNNSVIY